MAGLENTLSPPVIITGQNTASVTLSIDIGGVYNAKAQALTIILPTLPSGKTLPTAYGTGAGKWIASVIGEDGKTAITTFDSSIGKVDGYDAFFVRVSKVRPEPEDCMTSVVLTISSNFLSADTTNNDLKATVSLIGLPQ